MMLLKSIYTSVSPWFESKHLKFESKSQIKKVDRSNFKVISHH
jgi:hypothetical protein